MRRLETRLDGPVLIEPVVHGDARGFFQETFRKSDFADLGIHDDFVQDNHSRSVRGVLRGMHFQPGQAKLVRCARGAIQDVIADIRPGSPSFGRWEGFELDDVSHRQLYVPEGFAHGFCVLSDVADVVYKVSSYYDPAAEAGFRFDDPGVGIDWPQDIELQVSERDRTAPLLGELALGGLSDYVLAEVEQLADRPSLDELMERLAAEQPVEIDEPPEATIRRLRGGR